MINKQIIGKLASKYCNNHFLRTFLRPLWKLYHEREFQRQIKNFHKNGQSLLYEIYLICSEKNIFIWLEFGTLLGAYRENDFIKHDFDIDLGVMFIDKNKLEEAMYNHGFELVREFTITENNELIGAEQTYSYKSVLVDIFFYHQVDQQSVKLHSFTPISGIPQYEGRADIKEIVMPFFGFEKTFFKGIEVYIPKNTSVYLSQYYGKDFMIPDSNYDYRKTMTNITYIKREERTAKYRELKRLYL
ncbi:MAG: LicD family protein [Bacteroidales bacterium]|nr:LicD family protein [Bacteroidales bacterium]